MKEIAEILCRICGMKCNPTDLCQVRDASVKSILALIEQEQKPMVEALKEARKDLETIQSGEGPYNRDPLKHLENCYEAMIETAGKTLAKIDAVLPKGEEK